MILLISSPSFQLINQTLQAYLNKVDPTTLIEKMDGSSISISTWLSQILQPSLWSEKKLTIISQPSFFGKTTLRQSSQKKEDEEALENFLKQKNLDVDLIFLYQGEIDERLTLAKLIIKNHDWQHLEIPSKDQALILAQDWIKSLGATISSKALSKLLASTYPDVDRLYQEIHKLIVYGSTIEEKTIDLMVKPNLEDNVFELTNQIMAENLKQALKIYQDFMVLQIEPTVLISMLGKHFQLFAKVCYLLDQGLDTFKISQTLKIHEFRIRLMSQAKKRFPLKRINQILLSLDQLDDRIKKGRQDKVEALSWWLVNFTKPTS
ncbi:MAG: polymerase subunit delta [Bacillota bacterium]|jgi:DNA polymerase-3 subunit delta